MQNSSFPEKSGERIPLREHPNKNAASVELHGNCSTNGYENDRVSCAT
ncbi:hypothetical protein C8N30_3518 [Sulfitobacter guttiformis]|uniref:Uncharacterized protein n=1 Tax=Sulfitobacter guttiformis TaxID=74349 RepID=A0A420DJI0_9RHOB|nr:hypothetical protein C8N30_3518 [Sulfitobacter guttiformis]